VLADRFEIAYNKTHSDLEEIGDLESRLANYLKK
jgi:hypothetical protein